MSNQNITNDLLVELSTNEQELLSGGHYRYQRRRRGGIRVKNENNPVNNPTIIINPPGYFQGYSQGSDYSQDQDYFQDPDYSQGSDYDRQIPMSGRYRLYGNVYR
jgi:hypothetical protein